MLGKLNRAHANARIYRTYSTCIRKSSCKSVRQCMTAPSGGIPEVEPSNTMGVKTQTMCALQIGTYTTMY